MRRRSLSYRSHHNLWLARKIVARQPLLTRNQRYQLLPQTLGLMATAPEQTNFWSKSRFDQESQVTSPLLRRVFRPAYMEPVEDELTHDEHEVSPAPNESEEISGRQPTRAIARVAPTIHEPETPSQERLPEEHNEGLVINPSAMQSQRHLPEELPAAARVYEPEVPMIHREEAHPVPKINEPVVAKLPEEHGKAKRRRGRIDERPVEAEHAPHTPPSPSSSSSAVTHRGTLETKVLNGVNVPVEQEEQGEQEKQTSTEVIAADQLFASRDTDRSPQAWLARLQRDNTPSHEIAALSSSVPTAVEQKDRQVQPLSQQTRRFLQPFVGIDLASVNVHRDAIAEQLTGAYQADAITRGNDVEIAAGNQDDTPETLGLLAHEFTHVARQREPRFIPPIARSSAGQSSSMDEEALAQRVEGRVKRVAQRHVERMLPIATPAQGASIELPDEMTRSALTPVPVAASHRESWGGLPAPWEPLPDWLVASPSMEESSTSQAVVMPSQPLPVGDRTMDEESRGSETYNGTSRDMWTGSRSAHGGVQRAGLERSSRVEEVQTVPSASQPSPDTTKTPEADLDALARQVYALLKRRLGVEYRRES